jgi:uncharacterized protein
MKTVDLNILIYAVNRDSVHHTKAKRWLEQAMREDEPVALPWCVLLGFVRITTNPRIMPEPLSPEQAVSVADGWLSQPVVRVLNPGEEHWRLLKELLMQTGTAGNLTTDAHLAALAVETGSTLYSSDSDFSRFERLRWVNPLRAQ